MYIFLWQETNAIICYFRKMLKKCHYFYCMSIKSFITTLAICLIACFTQAQENKLLITFKNNTTKVVKKGDHVRLAYPSSMLQVEKPGNIPPLLGFRGQVDSIGAESIWLRVDKRTGKKQVFEISNIHAIKGVSKSAELLSFIGSSLVIGGAAVLITDAADMNSGAVAFAGVFSLFPAALLTANVFYPTKPKRTVGEDYTLKVITIN